MKDMGNGRAYRYAHDEPEVFAAGESYLPEGVPPPAWYRPTGRGMEKQIAEKLEHLRQLDLAAGRK